MNERRVSLKFLGKRYTQFDVSIKVPETPRAYWDAVRTWC